MERFTITKLAVTDGYLVLEGTATSRPFRHTHNGERMYEPGVSWEIKGAAVRDPRTRDYAWSLAGVSSTTRGSASSTAAALDEMWIALDNQFSAFYAHVARVRREVEFSGPYINAALELWERER